MLLLLLSACIEQQVSALDPSLELSADALDFEEVVRGTRVTLTFFARNEGGGVLQVDSLALTEASDPTFSVDALEVDRIDPGEELPLRVSYAPEEIGVDWGELELITDDPERPTRRVSLSGEGVDPRLDVDPEALWFGDVLAGDSRSLDVDLTARGQGWLNIQEITLDDAEGVFSVSWPDEIELPQRLSPGSGFTLAVEYAPDQVAPHEGELLIRSNDPENPVVSVRLLGNAEGDGLGPPTVEITSPDWGNYLLLGEVAELRGSVVDDADPPPNLLTAWYSDSQLLGVVTADGSGRVALDTDALPLGEQTLTLRAVDSAGNQASDDVDVVVWDPEEPVLYTLSGGETVFDWFTVDDDLTVMLDGEVIFQDSNHTQDAHAPLQFEAERGQSLRIIANDVNPCQKRLTPLTLHFGTSASQALNEEICVSSCAQDACYDPDYEGPWPNVFFDETYEITIP